MTALEATNLYLVSVTASNPAVFTPCTPNNHRDLRYYLVIAKPQAVLNIPLPLNGLLPTHGPVIRILLAFQQSVAFTRFNLPVVAEDTIRTILCSLWAFWSDLHGIPAHVYPEFCTRLKELTPSEEPEGGDVTLAMGHFVEWVKGQVGAWALRYRDIDADEVQDAVQQLYGYKLTSYREVQAGDGGEQDPNSAAAARGRTWVRLHRQAKGTRNLFAYSPENFSVWDIQRRYDDDSSDGESMSTEDTTREAAQTAGMPATLSTMRMPSRMPSPDAPMSTEDATQEAAQTAGMPAALSTTRMHSAAADNEVVVTPALASSRGDAPDIDLETPFDAMRAWRYTHWVPGPWSRSWITPARRPQK